MIWVGRFSASEGKHGVVQCPERLERLSAKKKIVEIANRDAPHENFQRLSLRTLSTACFQFEKTPEALFGFKQQGALQQLYSSWQSAPLASEIHQAEEVAIEANALSLPAPWKSS